MLVALQCLLHQVNVMQTHSLFLCMVFPPFTVNVIFGLCITQELGAALQCQGLLEDKDWEEVKDSLSKSAAAAPDLVQLKHLQHQVRAVQC